MLVKEDVCLSAHLPVFIFRDGCKEESDGQMRLLFFIVATFQKTFLFVCLMYMGVLSARVSVSYVCLVFCRDQSSVLDPRGLELQMALSLCMN